MPYPTKITRDQILTASRQMVELRDVDGFSLAGVAEALDVKTPSLYRYFDSKNDLLRELNLAFLKDLMRAMDAAAEQSVAPKGRLLGALKSYRAFAHASPNAYRLAFASLNDDLRPDEDLLVQMVLPFQEAIAVIAGPDDSLAALRGAFALVHGFVMLELSDQLRRGGDLDLTFQQVIEAYLRGWESGEAITFPPARVAV